MRKNATRHQGIPASPARLGLSNSTGALIRDVYRLEVRLLAERLAARGAAIGSWFYLRVLWQNDGITQRELGRRIGVNDATVGYALEGLERMKLILRRRTNDDRRKIHVFLTAKGRRLELKLLPVAGDINKTILKGFSAAEEARFFGYLSRARSNLEGVGPEKDRTIDAN